MRNSAAVATQYHLVDPDCRHSRHAPPTLCGASTKEVQYVDDPYEATCPQCRKILKKERR